MADNEKTITTHSPEETMEMSFLLSRNLRRGDFIALIGDLGSGKTVFVKGLARGLGIENYAYVNSPSFVVVKEYHGRKDLYHLDVYRLDPESFCTTLDYKKYFYGNGITVVEWADKIRDILPEDYLEVVIEFADHTKRKFTFRAFGEGACGIIRKLQTVPETRRQRGA